MQPTDGPDEVLRDIITALALCGVQGGKEPGLEDGSREMRVLMHLWDKRKELHAGFPDKKTFAAGFLADRCALWFRRSPVAQLLGVDAAEVDLFYDNHVLHQRLLTTWEALPDDPEQVKWQPLYSLVGFDAILNKLEKVGIPRDTLVNPARALFFGLDDHVIWLGCRDDISLKHQLPAATKEWRARRLQEPLTRLAIEPFLTPRTTLDWWQHANGQADMLADTFSALCRDLISGLGKVTTGDDPYDILTNSEIEIATPAVVAYIAEPTTTETNQLLKLAKSVLRENDARTLVLCVRLHYADVELLLNDPRVIADGLRHKKVHILSLDHLPAHLSRMPWVWSKWFGAERGFHVLRDEPDRLWDVLFRNERPHCERTEVIPRVVINDLVGQQWRRSCIVGPSGSGRTTALYQALSAESSRVVVLIERSCSSEDLIVASRLVAWLTETASVVVAVDDADDLRPDLRDTLERFTNKGCTLLVTAQAAPLQNITRVEITVAEAWLTRTIAERMLGVETMRWWWRHAAFCDELLRGGLCTVRDVVSSLELLRPKAALVQQRLNAFQEEYRDLLGDAQSDVLRLLGEKATKAAVEVGGSLAGIVTSGLGPDEQATQAAHETFERAKEHLHDAELRPDPLVFAKMMERMATIPAMAERFCDVFDLQADDEVARQFLQRWLHYDPGVPRWAEIAPLVRLLGFLAWLRLPVASFTTVRAYYQVIQRAVTLDPQACATALTALSAIEEVRVLAGHVDLRHPGLKAIGDHESKDDSWIAMIREGADDENIAERPRLLLLLTFRLIGDERGREAVDCLRHLLTQFPDSPQDVRAQQLALLFRIRGAEGGCTAYLRDLVSLRREDIAGILADTALLFQPHLIRRSSLNWLEALTDTSVELGDPIVSWLLLPIFDIDPSGLMSTPDAWEVFAREVFGSEQVIAIEVAIRVVREVAARGRPSIARKLVAALRARKSASAADLTMLEEELGRQSDTGG